LVLPSHQQHLEGGDGSSPCNGKPSHFDAADCPRTFHWSLSPQKISRLISCEHGDKFSGSIKCREVFD